VCGPADTRTAVADAIVLHTDAARGFEVAAVTNLTTATHGASKSLADRLAETRRLNVVTCL